MNTNSARLGMAAVAAFYVVIVGLWAADYFPLHKFYAQIEVIDAAVERYGYPAVFDSKEYENAEAYQQKYALTHGSIPQTESKLAFYRALLLWGTVAFGTGGAVLFLTGRKRKGQLTASNAD